MKQPSVYIMASQNRSTLYIGVTSNLLQRVYQHRTGMFDGFTSKYNCKHLVYFEFFEVLEYAIMREKRLKKYRRAEKEKLISKFNPLFRDLYFDLVS